VVALDGEGFTEYLKKTGKSAEKIAFDIRHMQQFDEYLLAHRGKTLDEAAPDDLQDYVKWSEETGTRIWMWVFNRYYSYTQNDTMYCATNELMGSQGLKKTKLKDFLGVELQHVRVLSAAGIVTAAQMLDAGRTGESRAILTEQTGVPPAVILELVKLSNLARIIGLKRKRARLFVDAGLDTLNKIARMDAEEMRHHLVEFVERTGFDGTASTPSEAAHTVRLAKYLPRIVEY
jgi:hypothetical protein